MKPGQISFGTLLISLLCSGCSNDVDDTDKKPKKQQFRAEDIVQFVEPSFACITSELYDEAIQHAVLKEKTKFEAKFSNFDCVKIPMNTDFKILSVHTGTGVTGIEITNAKNTKKANGMFTSNDYAVLSSSIANQK